MADKSVQLKPAKVSLDQLFLDPNNPRLAKSLNLRATVGDDQVAAAQTDLLKLFVNDNDSEPVIDDEDWESGEGSIGIGDLVRSMQEIGFVPVDQVVVRPLSNSPDNFLVIEGNRRVAAAKFLSNVEPSRLRADKRVQHPDILVTLRELDVLVLDTHGLSAEQVHHQIGVILGLRHFGQVLQWGTLARAVNIYNEYVRMSPRQSEFKLEAERVTRVATLLSESRSGVLNALRTYVAYQQLRQAFPGQLRPSHYSLLQACVINKKLAAHKYVSANSTTFEQSQESLERLSAICEFEQRDAPDAKNILPDPKAVSKFAGLVADASGHVDAVVQGVAKSLLQQVLDKELIIEDATASLRLFTADRKWVHSLGALLKKVVAPSEQAEPSDGRLRVAGFDPSGNELMKLEETRRAFKNVRLIFGR